MKGPCVSRILGSKSICECGTPATATQTYVLREGETFEQFTEIRP
jgi:hypothetical protein